MTHETDWLHEHMAKADIVIPLGAIANPLQYVENPIRVFELDFEANLQIIRLCKKYHKRLIFPSSSEVYGMCADLFFDEKKSQCVTGAIHKERWIYSNAKQLLDRIIYAYGKHENLNYSIFRPFNWYGERLDNPTDKSARVITKFIGNILRGEDILLSDGGKQKRAFTYIDDGIEALLKIIDNKNNNAHQKIFNIGNPFAVITVAELAELIISAMQEYVDVTSIHIRFEKSANLYGEGYEDISHRAPSIHAIESDLGWKPKVGLQEGLKKMIAGMMRTIQHPVLVG
jgi:nucleoside-diphosphate-sugar epimerase